MKLRNLIFLCCPFLILSCKREYKVEGHKVYFLSWNEGTGNNKWLIDSADGSTFKTLKFDCDCSFTFGRDAKHIFMDGELVKSVDPNTFEFIGNYIFRDKDSAYFFGFYNNLNDCIISNVNPNKIHLIKYPWAKAGNILIHGSDTIMLEDINDFTPLDEDCGKTKFKVINENRILFGTDPATFQVINSYSGKDKTHTYEFGKIKE